MTKIPAVVTYPSGVVPWGVQAPEEFSDSSLFELEDQESVIRKYWRVLYRRRWLIISVIAACGTAALLISMLTPRQFTATARIQVEREAAKILDIEDVEQAESPLSSAEFYQTQYALMKSRSLAESVVRSLSLADNYRFLSSFDTGSEAGLRALARNERFKLATEKVIDSTTISPVRMSSIVDIQVELAEPAMAATVANELAEKFIETNLSRRFEATAYARQFLQNRLNSVRARLEESERRATDYARRQGLINIATGTTAGQETTEQPLVAAELGHLTSQLSLARAARERAEADFRASTGGDAADRALSNQTVTQLRQQRAELTGELRKLESDYGPEYPRVMALRAQVSELDKQVAQEEAVVRSGVGRENQDQFRQALAAEQGLQRRVDQLKSAVLDQKQRSIQFNIIQRDVDTNRALYDALLQRFKEVGVAGGIGTNNVSIVDRALPPERPSSPNLPLNIALGLILGLALGAGAAIVLDQLSESVILPAEFQRKLGIPLLGSTPAVPGEMRKSMFAPLATVNGDLARHPSDNSELSEAYFSVLTAVQFSTAKGAPKTLSVTSSQPGEGKSTTAFAIARALASVGARVLIIDGDMRNPSLHKSLGIKPRRGLSDVLTGQATLMDVVHSPDGIGLSVVTAGQVPPNPAELLGSSALGSALTVAADNFDHVIVDSPPILGLADAPLVARAVEGTIFVVESGRTRATQARQAVERLLAVRAHILGAVLTKLDSRSSGYGYGYGYNYKYGT